MKKYQILIASAIIVMAATFAFMTGCRKNSKESSGGGNDPASEQVNKASVKNVQSTVFYDAKSKMSYQLTDQNQLNILVKTFANEKVPVEIMTSSYGELRDKNGPFPAISATYKTGSYITRLVVPLVENGPDLLDGGCVMKCTSGLNCSECTQTIIEKCKSQTCTCTSGTGGCTSSITITN